MTCNNYRGPSLDARPHLNAHTVTRFNAMLYFVYWGIHDRLVMVNSKSVTLAEVLFFCERQSTKAARGPEPCNHDSE